MLRYKAVEYNKTTAKDLARTPLYQTTFATSKPSAQCREKENL